MVIRETIRLGKSDAAKPSPLSVRFAHPTQRNSVLPFSKNLSSSSNIKIDKSIPKAYRETYKRFKKEAYKLKTVQGYQTQVVFDQHKLILRYKIKDDESSEYNYTIREEWNGPPPGAPLPIASTSQGQTNGKLPTPIIDTSSNSEACRTVIMTKVVSNGSALETTEKLRQHFSHMMADIVSIAHRFQGTYVVVCKDWNTCKSLVENYKSTKFNDKTPEFLLFSENEPSTCN